MAQQYCRGDFISWDPKITTFPGLYYLGVMYAWLSSLLLSWAGATLVSVCTGSMVGNRSMVGISPPDSGHLGGLWVAKMQLCMLGFPSSWPASAILPCAAVRSCLTWVQRTLAVVSLPAECLGSKDG